MSIIEAGHQAAFSSKTLPLSFLSPHRSNQQIVFRQEELQRIFIAVKCQVPVLYRLEQVIKILHCRFRVTTAVNAREPIQEGSIRVRDTVALYEHIKRMEFHV